MLRTFISNPTLGGFGGESEPSSTHPSEAPTPDAFCQIIKELVDNAVDACTVHSNNNNSSANSSASRKSSAKKRVRVVIERYQDCRKQPQNDSDGNEDDEDDLSVKTLDDSGEILRVMVSDNGCGMEDIQACVGAFHTSKAHNTVAAQTSTATATKKGSSYKTKGNSKTKKSNNKKSSSSSSPLPSETAPPPTEAQTAGRYGIGLTLCLLHAQRLVPDSCAFIQSARPADAAWKVVTAIVDADQDVVQCLPRQGLAKSFAHESGTSISILVPGGSTAAMAWPRLAEYFARFKLSLGMTCNLEVRAPTLSRVPLFVEPAVLGPSKNVPDQSNAPSDKSNPKRVSKQRTKTQDSDSDDDDDCDDDFSSSSEKLRDINQDNEAEQQSSGNDGKEEEESIPKAEPVSEERLAIWKATQQFLGRPVDLNNVAHFVAPIRAKTAKGKGREKTGPQLEVDVIVYGPHEDDDLDDCDFDGMSRNGDDDDGDGDDDEDDYSPLRSQPTKINEEESKSASLVLIRLVNKIPLLDSSEAVACGLVQGLSSKKRMWNSFGLNVGLKVDPSNVNKLPMFEVTDSEQVAPFFKSGAHNLLEQDDESDVETEKDVEDDDNGSVDHAAANNTGPKRKRQNKRHRSLLPASVRIGNILVIAQIHAEPTTLPLPTLSKGRLPIDNKAIDDALEIGVTKCLLQLQKTNPSLLLTTSELRKAERDARYVPAVALALASILTKSVTSPDPTVLERIQKWNSAAPAIPSHIVTMTDDSSDSSQHPSSSGQNKASRQGKEFNTEDVESLGLLIEERLRLVISQSEKKGKPKKQSAAEKEADADKENEMSVSSNLDDASVEGLNVDWDLLQQQFEATKGTTKNTNNNPTMLESNGGESAARATRFDESSDDDDFEDLF